MLRRGVLPGLQEGICSTTDGHGLWAQPALSPRAEGSLCRSAPPPPPLAALTSVFAEVFPSLPSSSQVSLLQYLNPEAQPPSLIGSALARGRSDFQKLLTAATPVAPLLLPNPATHKPTTTAFALSTPLKSP